jgi:hypothetical protein
VVAVAVDGDLDFINDRTLGLVGLSWVACDELEVDVDGLWILVRVLGVLLAESWQDQVHVVGLARLEVNVVVGGIDSHEGICAGFNPSAYHLAGVVGPGWVEHLDGALKIAAALRVVDIKTGDLDSLRSLASLGDSVVELACSARWLELGEIGLHESVGSACVDRGLVLDDD